MATGKKVMCHNSWRTVTWQQMAWILTKKACCGKRHWLNKCFTPLLLHTGIRPTNFTEILTVQIPQLVKYYIFDWFYFQAFILSTFPLCIIVWYIEFVSCVSPAFSVCIFFLQIPQFVPKIFCLASVCVQKVSVQALYTCIDGWMGDIIIQITEPVLKEILPCCFKETSTFKS